MKKIATTMIGLVVVALGGVLVGVLIAYVLPRVGF